MSKGLRMATNQSVDFDRRGFAFTKDRTAMTKHKSLSSLFSKDLAVKSQLKPSGSPKSKNKLYQVKESPYADNSKSIKFPNSKPNQRRSTTPKQQYNATPIKKASTNGGAALVNPPRRNQSLSTFNLLDGSQASLQLKTPIHRSSISYNALASTFEFEEETSKVNSNDRKHAKGLEERLAEQINSLSHKVYINSEDLARKKLEVLGKVFNEIISRNIIYGNLLKTIKETYENLVLECGTEMQREAISKLEDELSDTRIKMKDGHREIKYLKRKVEKLAKESVYLSRSLDDKEKEYSELQERMYKITKSSIENIPRDEIGWKMLVSEISCYAELVKQLKRKLRAFRERENELAKLIYSLKKKGYPIEEIYRADVSKSNTKSEHKNESPRFKTTDSSNEEDFEAEPIATGPPKQVPRPNGVPPLKLDSILQASFSDSEGDSILSKEPDPLKSYLI
jgi:hypothetical protein